MCYIIRFIAKPAGQIFVATRVGDPFAAAKDLGFEWTVDLEEGLQLLIEWRRYHKEAVEKRRRKAGI